MINVRANRSLKNLGCKWNGSSWVPPDLAKKEAQEINDKYYSDLVIIEVTVTGDLCHGDLGPCDALTVAGYVVASVFSKSSKVKIADNVAITRGELSAGGSNKYPSVHYTSDLVIKMKISKSMITELDKQVSAGRYTYKIIEES